MLRNLVPAVGLLLLAIALFYFSWLVWQKANRFAAGSVSATGKVVALEAPQLTDNAFSVDKTSNNALAPVVEFTAQDGKKVRFNSKNAQNPPAYQVGEEVQVRYHPNQPEQAQVVSSFWGGAGLILLGAIAALLAALVYGVRAFRAG